VGVLERRTNPGAAGQPKGKIKKKEISEEKKDNRFNAKTVREERKGVAP